MMKAFLKLQEDYDRLLKAALQAVAELDKI